MGNGHAAHQKSEIWFGLGVVDEVEVHQLLQFEVIRLLARRNDAPVIGIF